MSDNSEDDYANERRYAMDYLECHGGEDPDIDREMNMTMYGRNYDSHDDEPDGWRFMDEDEEEEPRPKRKDKARKKLIAKHKKSNNTCHFFLRGTCKYGSRCRFRHPELVKAVCAIIYDDRGWILIGKDPKNFFVWTLPTGKVDPGESDMVGMLREIYEETNLRFTPFHGCRLGTTNHIQPYSIVVYSFKYKDATNCIGECLPRSDNDLLHEMKFADPETLDEISPARGCVKLLKHPVDDCVDNCSFLDKLNRHVQHVSASALLERDAVMMQSVDEFREHHLNMSRASFAKLELKHDQVRDAKKLVIEQINGIDDRVPYWDYDSSDEYYKDDDGKVVWRERCDIYRPTMSQRLDIAKERWCEECGDKGIIFKGHLTHQKVPNGTRLRCTQCLVVDVNVRKEMKNVLCSIVSHSPRHRLTDVRPQDQLHLIRDSHYGDRVIVSSDRFDQMRSTLDWYTSQRHSFNTCLNYLVDKMETEREKWEKERDSWKRLAMELARRLENVTTTVELVEPVTDESEWHGQFANPVVATEVRDATVVQSDNGHPVLNISNFFSQRFRGAERSE